jgi:hypothetical protein
LLAAAGPHWSNVDRHADRLGPRPAVLARHLKIRVDLGYEPLAPSEQVLAVAHLGDD